jgi:thiamine pyrophosphate-dependent acetolactate synthase large subunit-like protein
MAQEKEEKMVFDTLKPMHEETPQIPPEMMEIVDVTQLIGEIVKEEGIKYCFGLVGSGAVRLDVLLQKSGLQRVHVRHEAAATFAADAVGRLTGRPGLAFVGPGTGMTNAASGLLQAKAAQSPGVILIGGTGTLYDDLFTQQGGASAESVYSALTKHTRRVSNAMSLLYQIKRAFRSAVTPPMGPVGVEIAEELTFFAGIFGRLPRMLLYSLYRPGWPPKHQDNGANPAEVEKAIQWLLQAERPAMIVGESIHYDQAEEELKEFVGLLGIPCHCRRVARGAISEYSPLNYYGRARGKVLKASDRCLVMGLRIAYLENWGLPPFWGPMTRYIQAQTCQENVCFNLPTEFELRGNMKAILQQMIDCVKSLGITKPPEKWDQWRQQVAAEKEKMEKITLERTEKMRGKTPLHPDLAGRIISEVLRDELKDEYIAVIDGFTASAYFTDWNKAIHSGQVLDAAETIGMGHAPGMVLGAGLATDRKVPILAIMGDGAIGAGGMDIETVARWGIPAVFLHENNNTMISGVWDRFFSEVANPTGSRLRDSWEVLPNIRHEKIFAEFGCHPEFVQRDEELGPALKRAFNFVREKSMPAFVEVFVDPTVMHDVIAKFFPLLVGCLKWEELPLETRKMALEQGLITEEALFFMGEPSWREALERYKKGEKVF